MANWGKLGRDREYFGVAYRKAVIPVLAHLLSQHQDSELFLYVVAGGDGHFSRIVLDPMRLALAKKGLRLDRWYTFEASCQAHRLLQLRRIYSLENTEES